jgi:DNA-binding MarR family transcriptional regulator
MPEPADAVNAATSAVRSLLRTARKAKARMMADARGDVESAMQALLHIVASEGPMRTSALAASAQSDLSTVSRQVAALVSSGLLERRADPADGRASLLALTPSGEAILAQYERASAAFYAEVLDGWSPDELEQFSALLGKFTAAWDQVQASRLAGQVAHRPVKPLASKGSLS